MQKTIFLIVNFLIALIILSNSCKDNTNSNNHDNNIDTTSNQDVISKQDIITINITNPDSSVFIIGDIAKIDVKVEANSDIDSLGLFINNKFIKIFYKTNFSYDWNSINSKVGKNIFHVIIYKNDKKQRKEAEVFFLSDIIPKQQSYKIINIFPHDRDAYTQGLIFYNDILYEATGIKGESSIRKTKLETGDIIRSYTISSTIFGEGITIFDEKIIQLSWQAGVGYIYELETFKKIHEFRYITEGWGLTNDDEHLYMSDGTNKIYILETQSYSIIDQIEVCDNEVAVNHLNELEFINGEIYANIYMTDKIARIDPKTGKILAYINLKNILPISERDADTDVLNGIAYDKINNRLFVTGKKWSKLFEIEIK